MKQINNYIYIMRGLPASGKSTESNKILNKENCEGLDTFRINKSELRKMLWPQHHWSVAFETEVQKIEFDIARNLLKEGFNVIIDSTNLKEKDISKWKKLTKRIKIFDFRNTPLESCLHRDILRKENPCGPAVIIKLARENNLLK